MTRLETRPVDYIEKPVGDYWKKTLMTTEQEQSGPIKDEDKQKSRQKTGGIRNTGGQPQCLKVDRAHLKVKPKTQSWIKTQGPLPPPWGVRTRSFSSGELPRPETTPHQAAAAVITERWLIDGRAHPLPGRGLQS